MLHLTQLRKKYIKNTIIWQEEKGKRKKMTMEKLTERKIKKSGSKRFSRRNKYYNQIIKINNAISWQEERGKRKKLTERKVKKKVEVKNSSVEMNNTSE